MCDTRAFRNSKLINLVHNPQDLGKANMHIKLYTRLSNRDLTPKFRPLAKALKRAPNLSSIIIIIIK